MARFLTKLHTSQEFDKAYEWELTEPLIYESDIVGPIIVPAGFVFDKNSVPFGFRWLFPVAGRKSDYAATLHDWLYATELYPREVADCIYLEAMELADVSFLRAKSKYYAVKIGGGFVWSDHTKSSISAARDLIDLVVVEQLLQEHGFDKKAHTSWNLSYFRPELGAL